MGMEVDEEGWRRAGEAVETRRGVKRWSQKEAADRAHVDVSTWQEIEAGRGHASRFNTLAAVADALDWQPDQIQRIAAGEPTPWRAEAERATALEAQVVSLGDSLTTLLAGLNDLAAQVERLSQRVDRLDSPGE